MSLFQRLLALDGLDKPENRNVVRIGFAFALIAMLLRLIFWGYTHRYWEDALITCLHSENFALGKGLTHFRPDEPPLHGFTSPLSVLVPLIGDLIKVGFGLEFLKLMSIPASALTVLYLLAFAIHPKVKLATPLAVLLMGFAAFEHHQILYGMAGMETQLSVLILVMSVYYSVAWKLVPLAISLGLCMLVRPDYGFWTIIIGVYVLIKEPRSIFKVVGIAMAVYLPWIIFTTLYYGTPLPNTVVAKGLGYGKWWAGLEGGPGFSDFKRRAWVVMSEQLHFMLSPTFNGHGGGQHLFFFKGPESPLGNFMFLMAALGSLVIAVRRKWPLWPLVALVAVYTLYYAYLVPVVFGWYKNPYLITLLMLSAVGLNSIAALIPAPQWRTRTLAAFTIAYLGLFAAVLPITFYTERQIQLTVENQVRKPAGLYLAEHMKEDEAVGCEPLGYMSYYSRGNVYDWPGLASRTVVAWSKENPGKRNLQNMLNGLRPEYLFLRDMEFLYSFSAADRAWIQKDYHVVKAFQVPPEEAARVRWLNRNTDVSCRIYKKNHPDDTAPYDASLWPNEAAFQEYISAFAK
jgi:hypothetical protein